MEFMYDRGSNGESIRVLMLTTDSEICGTERIILSILRHLDPRRFQPALVTLYGPGDLVDAVREMKIPALNLRWKEESAFSALRKWRRFLNEFRPDLIQSLLIHSNVLGRLTVFFRNEIAMLGGISTVYTVEGYGRLYAWIERLTHPIDTLYVVNSEIGMRSVFDSIGLPEKKVVLVHNGIPIGGATVDSHLIRREIITEFGFPEESLIVGIVAQLRPAKRHDHLIRAVARLKGRFPGLRLLIVGKGEIESALKELAVRQGVAAETVFTGYRSDARRMMRGMDVFALSSVVEGEPVSVMEAMDAGLPVVAAATGGIPEIVRDGITGLLTPQNDLSAFCRALERLLDCSEERKAMGAAGRERVRAFFSEERMSREFQDLYLRCVPHKKC